MALQISLSPADTSASLDLKELMDKLRQEGVGVEPETASHPGAKSAILIGLSIASLTVSSISSTIAVLNFWGNKNKKNYRIVLHSGGKAIALADLSSGVFNQIVEGDESAEIVIEKI